MYRNNVGTKESNVANTSSIDVVSKPTIQRESHNDAEAARYGNRKQREQTVIKTAAREQSNDVATHLPRLLTDGNSLE